MNTETVEINFKVPEGEFLPDFFKRINKTVKMDDDTLFLDDSLLDKTPEDWMDFVMLLVGQNYRGCTNTIPPSYLITLNDEQTKKAFEFIPKDQIKIYVIDSNNSHLWEVMALNKEGKRIFVGGEQFRKFCDKRNIFYKSTLRGNENKLLMSVTDMKYQKVEGEDCRIPEEVKENEESQTS
jgi:hypothetical protein